MILPLSPKTIPSILKTVSLAIGADDLGQGASDLSPEDIDEYPGVYLPLSVVEVLVKNFFLGTTKTTSPNPLKPGSDTYNIWFSKKEVDDLFRANIPATTPNPNDYGLRVYLCQHGLTATELEQVGRVIGQVEPGTYGGYEKLNGQHGVVLVVTQKDSNGYDLDMLDNNNSVSLSAQYLTGLDVGQPCPPPAVCAGVRVIPVV